MVRRTYLVAAGTALALLLAAACGGGDDGPPVLNPPPGQTMSTLTVNGDGDDNSRDELLTLREALLLAGGTLDAADLTPGEERQIEGAPGASSSDTIIFAPDLIGDEGTVTITLSESLPILGAGFDGIEGGRAVIIDTVATDFSCIQIDSGGNWLFGLILQSCRTAILLDRNAQANRIGGPEEGQGNVISGNTVGIEVRGGENTIQGNIIGLDPTGSEPVPNKFEGIWLSRGSKDNLIGGTKPGEGNVISGNDLFGISIDGEGTTGNRLLGNFVGTDAHGVLGMSNKYGIVIQHGAQDNFVGETNVISGNNTAILIRDAETSGNVVSGNIIGFAIDGKTRLFNALDLLLADDPGENLVEDNVSAEPLNP